MLRPASLPATVALRASDTPQPKPSSSVNEGPSFAIEESKVDGDENLSQRDKELARLVNVITPSHRSAWKKDSRSWRLFFGAGNAEDTAPESPDSETEATSVTHDIDRNGNYGASPSLSQCPMTTHGSFLRRSLVKFWGLCVSTNFHCSSPTESCQKSLFRRTGRQDNPNLDIGWLS